MRNGTMGNGCNTRDGRRRTSCRAEWCCGVRSDGHAAHRVGCSTARHSHLEEIRLMNIDFPLHFDGRGRTAEADDDKHIRDMIEQLIFTAPGERVNRPTFGSGAQQLVFAPNSDALATAMRLSMQASLQEWLGDVIEVTDVQVEANDSTLRIEVQYVVRRTGETRVATLAR